MSDTDKTTDKPSYQVGIVRASRVDTEDDCFEFALDTALSWEGNFPDPGVGDYLVTIGSVDDDEREILVSRRYTSAVDADDAAAIALDAFAERHDYERDDEGKILEILDPTDPDSGVMGAPCWVSHVDVVQADVIQADDDDDDDDDDQD